MESIKNDTRTLIFYEAPHKLLTTLNALLDALGDRKITLARELTKKYEEFVRTTLAKAVTLYEETPPKGEFVLIIEGADEKQVQKELLSELPSAEELIRKYAAEDMRAKELTRRVADELKQPRRDIYDLYIKLKNSL